MITLKSAYSYTKADNGDVIMICNHCGESIPQDSVFCKKCGQPVGGGNENFCTRCNITYVGDECPNCKTPAFLPNRVGRIMSSDGSVIAFQETAYPNTLRFWQLRHAEMYNLTECPHCGKYLGDVDISNCPLCGEPIPKLFRTVEAYTNKSRRKVIKQQFRNDRSSICPSCGSHSVSVRRRGYNWNEAFWGEMFNIKGSRYTAGMGANDKICTCNHCGRRWVL